jgi:hypothetical protein
MSDVRDVTVTPVGVKSLRAVAAFVVSRFLLVLIPLGLAPYFTDGFVFLPDVQLYGRWANDIALSGQLPVGDQMWQYPPAAAAIFLMTVMTSLSPVVVFVVLALCADIAVFALLLRRARRGMSFAGPWTWIIAGLCVGPTLLTRFDIFPTLFAVGGLLLLARPVRAGAMIAIGALLKVWPAFLIVAVPPKALGRFTAGLVATGAAGLVTCLLVWDGALAFLEQQGARGIQVESVAALPYVVAGFVQGNIPTEFRYGAVEVLGSGTEIMGLAMTVIGFAMMGVIGYWRWRGQLPTVAPADIALVVILISIATSRVFSPQYMIWVAGIAAVVMLNRQTVMRPVVFLALSCAVLGQLVYPVTYRLLLEAQLVGVGFQVARIALLLAALAWGWKTLATARRTHLDSVAQSADEESVEVLEPTGRLTTVGGTRG